LLQVIDIAAVAAVAHAHGALVAVDSTFATPVNQQTLALGADMVIHSATKYLGGHSDLTGGVVAASAALLQAVNGWRKNLGQCMAPETAHLLARSLATLELRVGRQNASAGRIAAFLQAHPAVERVYYPGLPQHGGHDIAKKQMSGFGGMLSVALKAGVDAAAFVDGLQIFSLAVSLGGIESLVCQPGRTSHRGLSPALKAEKGITDQLIRVSIGLEDAEDLEQDLVQALTAAVQAG